MHCEAAAEQASAMLQRTLQFSTKKQLITVTLKTMSVKHEILLIIAFPVFAKLYTKFPIIGTFR